MNSIGHLFVYGTLLPGLCRAHLLDDALDLGKATIVAHLFDLGDYPGIVVNHPQSTSVEGRLYQVSPELLNRLDAEEEFDSQNPNASLYLRVIVRVRLDRVGISQDAWVYVYNQYHDNATAIAHGDYLRYLAEKV